MNSGCITGVSETGGRTCPCMFIPTLMNSARATAQCRGSGGAATASVFTPALFDYRDTMAVRTVGARVGTLSAAAMDAGFLSKRKARAAATAPPPAGDPSATLETLAARAVIQSCNEFCSPGVTVDDLRGVIDSMTTWPVICLDLVLPHVNPRLLLAARDAGLGDDERRLRGVSQAPSIAADMWSGESRLRKIATARMLDHAIRREETAYCQNRARVPLQGLEHSFRRRSRPAFASLCGKTPVEQESASGAATFDLVDVFAPGGLGQWLDACEAPSLPRSQLLFAHERERRAPSAGDAVFEPSLECFESNFDHLTRGMLAGLDWSGIVAAGGAVVACALRSPAGRASAQGLVSEDELDAMRHKWFDPSGAAHNDGRPSHSRWHSDAAASPFAASADVDLFLVGQPSVAAALATVQRVHRTMRRNFRAPVLACRTGSAVTLVAGGFPTRFVQVVLKLFPTAADVRAPGLCASSTPL